MGGDGGGTRDGVADEDDSGDGADADLAVEPTRQTAPDTVRRRPHADDLADTLQPGDVVWAEHEQDRARLGAGLQLLLDRHYEDPAGWRRVEITGTDPLVGRLLEVGGPPTVQPVVLARAWDAPVPTTLQVGAGFLASVGQRASWLPWAGWLVALVLLALLVLA